MISIPAAVAVTTAAAPVATVPPGVCTVILSNTSANPPGTNTNVIYVGTSNTVTTANGFPLPVNATVTFTANPGSKGATLYAIAAATGNNLGIIVTTAQ